MGNATSGKMQKPLTDEQFEWRINNLSIVMEDLQREKSIAILETLRPAIRDIYLWMKDEIMKIEEQYLQKEKNILRTSKLYIMRLSYEGRLRILEAADKNLTDVVLLVHYRLGRVDVKLHKKAYRRIMYALILQGICRLMEPIAVAVFREVDLMLGKSVFKKASEKYKSLTGLYVSAAVSIVVYRYAPMTLSMRQVKMLASEEEFLPLESCGGVEIRSSDGHRSVDNSLAQRLNLLLFKANPMIRLMLFGPNRKRRFFDMSKVSGTGALFDLPPTVTWPSVFGGVSASSALKLFAPLLEPGQTQEQLSQASGDGLTAQLSSLSWKGQRRQSYQLPRDSFVSTHKRPSPLAVL